MSKRRSDTQLQPQLQMQIQMQTEPSVGASETEIQTNAASATQDEPRTVTRRSTPPEHELETSAACAAAADEPLLGRFAARLAGDNITLALILGCLDVCSVLRCRRVSRVWHAASLKPEAWLDAILTLTTRQLLLVPANSLRALPRLCLAYDASIPTEMRSDLLFSCLASMPRLTTLRLELLHVGVDFCQLLSANVPQLQSLDMTTCTDHFCGIMARAWVLHEALPGDASFNSAAGGLVPKADKPSLLLPRLTTLHTHCAYSLHSLAWLVGQLPAPRTLHLRSHGSFGPRDALAEQLFERAMPRFYAPSLQSLTLYNTHFDCSHLTSLTQLTSLALVQSESSFVTPALLAMAAHDMPKLQQLRVCMTGPEAVRECTAEWWDALASVRVLTALSLEARDKQTGDMAVCQRGLAQLLALPHLRLRSLELRSGKLAQSFWQHRASLLELHSLALATHSLSVAAVEQLAALPQLRALELVAQERQMDYATLHAVAEHLVRLHTLRLLDDSPRWNRGGMGPEFCSIIEMPQLRSLSLGHMGVLNELHVAALRNQLRAAAQVDDERHRCDMVVFHGAPRPANIALPVRTCQLRELQLDTSMAKFRTCELLLSASQHLHITALYDSASFGADNCPAGGTVAPRYTLLCTRPDFVLCT